MMGGSPEEAGSVTVTVHISASLNKKKLVCFLKGWLLILFV